MAIAIDAILGSGALARGWSSYLASLCNYGGSKGFTVQSGHYELDFVAFGFMILLVIIVSAGTQQTSFINTGELTQPQTESLELLLLIILLDVDSWPDFHASFPSLLFRNTLKRCQLRD